MLMLKEMFYEWYFSCAAFFLPARDWYIIVDIDNTVNNQAERLRRFTVNGQCDFKQANRFDLLMRDVPLPGSASLISELSIQSRIVWLTSRSVNLMPATFYWLKKNRFPVNAIICTGTMLRKILFLQIFAKKHNIEFVIDDMKEGYESGTPYYVSSFKEYLLKNNIRFYEKLPSQEGLMEIKRNSHAS